MTTETLTLIAFLLARIADDEAAVESAITDTPFPSGWLGVVREALATNRRLVVLARDYCPELEHGDNGEWALDAMLREIALPYADHPDHRDEWRP